jgi:hypothetical protein
MQQLGDHEYQHIPIETDDNAPISGISFNKDGVAFQGLVQPRGATLLRAQNEKKFELFIQGLQIYLSQARAVVHVVRAHGVRFKHLESVLLHACGVYSEFRRWFSNHGASPE